MQGAYDQRGDPCAVRLTHGGRATMTTQKEQYENERTYTAPSPQGGDGASQDLPVKTTAPRPITRARFGRPLDHMR